MAMENSIFSEYKSEMSFIPNNSFSDLIDISKNTITGDARISRPVLTKYEWARLIGERTTQIIYGAIVDNDIKEGLSDPYDIAKREIKLKRIPFKILRKMPDGSYELWSLDELQILNI